MITLKTTFKIIATHGKNLKKKFEVPLDFQKIFSAFSDNNAPMRKEVKITHKRFREKKIIPAPFVETNIDFKT